MTYTLEIVNGSHVIMRGRQWVFILSPRDGMFAQEILHNLNHGKKAR